jgi:hypothetical protein
MLRHSQGGVVERFMAAVLKTAVGQPTVGSNPTPSATLLESTEHTKNGAFFRAGVRKNLAFVAVSNSPDDPLKGGSRIQLRARALRRVQEANAARITLSKCSRL